MGKLRITSGYLRGRQVTTPEGETTRPLLSRVRKSLMDILRPRLAGATVLDLFAGSGAIGFELLSNGAECCVLNELRPRTAAMIRDTAARLGVQVGVYNLDALEFLEKHSVEAGPFDLIVVAPPYGQGLQQQVLDRLPAESLHPHGVIVVQRDAQEPACQVDPQRFRLTRSRRYGRTYLEMYESADPDIL